MLQIPVVWINGRYYAKHSLDVDAVTTAIIAATNGEPVVPVGAEPDSSTFPAL